MERERERERGGAAGVKLALRDPNHRPLLVNAYVCSVRVEVF